MVQNYLLTDSKSDQKGIFLSHYQHIVAQKGVDNKEKNLTKRYCWI